MTTAIIVAAGSSTRFAGAQPKQFTSILGKPLIVHTLEKFDATPAIDSIVLVLLADAIGPFEQVLERFPISKLSSVVAGGSTRAVSVRNGLNAVDTEPDDIVAIHDGARPLVTVDEITRTVKRAAETGAACLVAAVTDTIKETNGNCIAGTVDRSKLKRSLTPQAFRYSLIRRAFEGSDLGDAVTDECYLVEKLGIEIAAVEGSPWNIKVTLPEDLVVAEALLAKEGR